MPEEAALVAPRGHGFDPRFRQASNVLQTSRLGIPPLRLCQRLLKLSQIAGRAGHRPVGPIAVFENIP